MLVAVVNGISSVNLKNFLLAYITTWFGSTGGLRKYSFIYVYIYIYISFIYLFIFWLYWVLVSAQAFFLVSVSRGYSLVVARGLLTAVASVAAELKLQGSHALYLWFSGSRTRLSSRAVPA